MNSESLEPITSDESTELTRLEQIVERDIKAFISAGAALLEIKDRRLYRENYPDFASYCRHRWRFGASHAYRLIAAAEVADNVPVESEREARELVGLEKDLQVAVHSIAKEIAGELPMTSTLLRQVREGVEDKVSEWLQGASTNPATGETIPLSVALKANVTTHVLENMERQRERIRSAIDKRTSDAHESGEPKQVPAQSAPVFLTYLIRENVRAMDKYIGEKGALHPALFNAYHLSKAILGESVEGDEVDFMTDPVTMAGLCERCGHNGDEPVQLSVISARSSGHIRSIKMLLCGFCVSVFSRGVEAIHGKAVEV